MTALSASAIERFKRLGKISSHGDDEEDNISEPMFTLHERYTRGSVAVARGNSRSSLSRKTGRQVSSRHVKAMQRTTRAIQSSHIMHNALIRESVGLGKRRQFARSVKGEECLDLTKEERQEIARSANGGEGIDLNKDLHEMYALYEKC